MGTVTDPTGAVIPGVTVTAINQGTGTKLSGTTNQRGDYSLFPLAPGTYDLAVEASGFSPSSVQGILVDVNTTLSRNFVLKVSGTTSEVTVSAQAVPLMAQSISVESVIDQEQLYAMPLNGRDFNQLVLLSPGATDNTAATGVNLDFGSYALNGNRAFSNEFLVDGVPNNNSFQGKAATPLSVDSIAEFKVISGVPTAEYGHAATAITSITKGGTNQIHGSLFNYYRGDILLASNPFDTNGSNETFLRNQFGGSLGGPVSVPHLIDGHGRTFFFFNYEGARQTDTALRVDTVPTDAYWSGDFSYLLSPSFCSTDPKKCIQLRDPFTTGRPNIPNNRLDLYRNGALISKTALALRPYFASPTMGPDKVTGNLVQFPEENSTSDQFTVRLDQVLPNNHALSGRFTYSNTGGFQPNFLGTPGVGMMEPQDSRNANLTWVAPIGTSMVNEFRLGAMNYSDIVTYISGDAPTVESLGMKGFDPGNPGLPLLPRITFSGTGTFSTLKYGPNDGYGEAALSMTSNVFSVADTLSVTKANHTLKVGFQTLRDYYNVLQQTNARGQITFSGSSTSSSSTGYSFADFLLGIPSSTQQVPIKPKSLLTETELAGFVQDTWHIRSNLTLDLGIRYEFSPSPSEAHNRLSMFTDKIPGGGFVVACSGGQTPTDQYLPSVIAKLTDASGNLTYQFVCATDIGYRGSNLVSTGSKNWAPRVGFIWDPSSKGLYSVKGGYGMVYSRYPIQYFLQTMLVNPPFAGLFPYSQKISSVNASGGGVPALTLLSPYGGTGSKPTVSPLGIDQDFVLPDNQQWNLGVARSLGNKMMGSISYIGNKGTHLFRSFNVNQRLVDPLTGAVVQTYSSTFGTSNIPVRRSDGNSIYNAMVLEFRRRASRNLNLQANWTWAKSIDDVSTNVQTSGLDILSPGRDRADSDYARRHTVSFNSTYNLPIGKGHAFAGHLPGWANSAVSAWVFSGIWHWSTGRFMTVSNTSQGGLSNNRPDVVPGVEANLPRDERTPSRWFNPLAFTPVPDPVNGALPRFGNAGRNTLIGPGQNVVDLSLRKAFRVGGEKGRLSLEMSVFNAFNHPNWGNPDTNISDTNTADGQYVYGISTVGTITTLSRPMRQAQFSARYDF